MAITHGNSFTGSSFSGGVATISVTGASAGDLIIIGGGWGFSGIALTSVADGPGTYTIAEQVTDAGGRTFVAYLENCVSGTHSITVTAASQPNFGKVFAHLVSGAALSASLDQHLSANGMTVTTTANSSSSGAVTPTTNGQYLFGMHMDTGGSINYTSGTDFTSAPTGAGSGLAQYYIQPTAASHAALAQSSSGTTFGAGMAIIATFKAAAGGASRGLFRTPSLGGLGSGGSFFRDPLQAPMQMVRRDRIFVPAWMGKAA